MYQWQCFTGACMHYSAVNLNTNWYYPRTLYFVARDSGLAFIICIFY